MTKTTLPKPEVGGDLLRVHRAITHAMEVTQEYAVTYAAAGYPDADTQAGYLTYARCVSAMLHGHHITEDKTMFPHLRPMLPDAPYETLMAQHGAMGPVLDEIDAAVEDAASSKPGPALDVLRSALERMGEMWQEHIALEEAHFGPDALDASLTMEARIRVGRVTSIHAARHQRPFSLMLAFLLYNMSPEDRAVMSQAIPAVRLLLALWKPRWRVMSPFLLVDA